MLFAFILFNSVDYFAPENIYKFAVYLYEQEDYLRAASEFERYLFSLDSLSPNADSIYYRIGLSYKLGGDMPKAIKYFQRSSLNKSSFQIAICYSLMGNYDKSNLLIESEIHKLTEKECLPFQELTALNYMQLRQWQSAINALANRSDSLTTVLSSFAKEGQHLSRKNLFLSGLLSTIIPGAGKVYCGRVWDGVFSFLIMGLGGWQSYEGFSSKDGIHSVRGWAFCLSSSIFYLGNIYGSTVEARIYNEQMEKALLNKVNTAVNIKFWF